MKIQLNGEPVDVNADTLNDLLLMFDYRSDGVATAINGDFVHRDARAEHQLREGDSVEIVAPIAGG